MPKRASASSSRRSAPGTVADAAPRAGIVSSPAAASASSSSAARQRARSVERRPGRDPGSTWIRKASPPGPHCCGSTTYSTRAAATAASIARRAGREQFRAGGRGARIGGGDAGGHAVEAYSTMPASARRVCSIPSGLAHRTRVTARGTSMQYDLFSVDDHIIEPPNVWVRSTAGRAPGGGSARDRGRRPPVLGLRGSPRRDDGPQRRRRQGATRSSRWTRCATPT